MNLDRFKLREHPDLPLTDRFAEQVPRDKARAELQFLLLMLICFASGVFWRELWGGLLFW